MKFRACLTHFAEVAEPASDAALFAHALDIFFKGAPDPKTLAILAAE